MPRIASPPAGSADSTWPTARSRRRPPRRRPAPARPPAADRRPVSRSRPTRSGTVVHRPSRTTSRSRRGDGQQHDDREGEAGAAAADVVGHAGTRAARGGAGAGDVGLGPAPRPGSMLVRAPRAGCWPPSTAVPSPGRWGAAAGRWGRPVGRAEGVRAGGAPAGRHGHRRDAEVGADVPRARRGTPRRPAGGRRGRGGWCGRRARRPARPGRGPRRTASARRGARAGRRRPAGCRRRRAGAR